MLKIFASVLFVMGLGVLLFASGYVTGPSSGGSDSSSIWHAHL